MARSSRIKLLVVATVAIILLIFIVPSSPFYYNPQTSSSGIHLKGCLYDSSGNQIGCNSAFKVPIGQSITGAGGASIASIRIPSAYATLNYTGQATSVSLSATELASYAKGVGESFAVSYSSSSPVKSFNITLPKSSWTTSELQTKWGSSYGTKLVNITLANPTLTVKFANGITVTKPSAFNYQVQFTLNYGQGITTSTTSTTISTTTSTSTTITGGVSSGTTDIWTTTITSASGGTTGNTASNGIIATLAPDYYFPSSQSVVWVYYSAAAYSSCSGGIFVAVVTPSTSVTVGRLTVFSNTWSGGISIPTAVTSGNSYLVQVLCANSASTVLFNQVVTASATQTNAAYGANLPPPPYDAQYIATLQPAPAITTAITSSTTTVIGTITSTVMVTPTFSTWVATNGATYTACYSGGVQLASPKPCYPPLSVISVTF